MKRKAKQIVSILLIFCMCLAMVPQMMPPAAAVTPTYTVSSAYQSSSYYSALLDVELTGNQRDDIINVALSQVGYREGNYSGDYSGADDGSYNNYTEYNYWYNNYINSGMPVGGSYAPWCATFVSWCAEQAQIPTSILNRSTAAGHTSYYFNVNFYAGGSTLASSSDNDSYFMGYNYTPKKGDLFFTRSWSHVGLVVDSDGTYVTTVEGNTNNDGSADGFGVFVRTRYVDDLYFGVPEYVESYLGASCTYYASNGQLTVDSATTVNSQPCSEGNNDSEVLENASAGATYTVTGLYQNSYGNFWYQVETSSGDTGYVYAGESTFFGHRYDDIALSSDATAPNGHVAGNVFVVNGTISSQYSGLTQAAVYIYSGFGTSGTPVTGDSASVSGKSYVLDNSTIDYNTSFGSLSVGKYTYAITVDYTNYYATDATTLASTSGTVELMQEYFMVISASVDQSTCAHSYTTTVLEAATCTDAGAQVKSCATCGNVITEANSASGHSYGSWTTVAATCTTDGYKTRICSTCGNVEEQAIAATGHSYSVTTTPANCQNYEIFHYTCGQCGDNYSISANELSSWSTSKPLGVADSLIETKTQYRYADCTSTTWQQSATGSVEYVDSWPSGFLTTNSLYSQYNKKSSKVTSSETDTTKITINSDGVTGYLYYHWCYADSYYCVSEKSGSYTTFHAYYSTSNPDNYTCDTSDMSYKTSHSTCSNSNWWFVCEVNTQAYTTYTAVPDGQQWGDWSDWSDTVYTAVENSRKVETRTMYRYTGAALGGHVWSQGACSVCGTVCSHSYVDGVCSVCGFGEPVKDFYLFGYINGANYGCEDDYETIGEYKFEDGKLVATFNAISYVAVKTADNSKWYMTNGYAGDSATSVTLYTTDITGSNSNKLRVPRGREITFTLVQNSDGSLTLSYVAAACTHSWADGVCSICDEICAHSWSGGACGICGAACDHSWSDGVCGNCGQVCGTHSYVNNVCTNCGMSKPTKDYYLFGYINGTNYACEEDYANIGTYKFVGGKLVATFESDSYVAVKSGDNTDWYMTNGWQGTEVTSVTLYNNNSGITSEKMYVPGGVEVTFTLVDNGDDTFTLSYVAAEVAVVAPTTSLTGASLAFEDEIYYNIYFTADDLSSVVEMGLVTFNEKLSDGTIENAVDVIPGYEIVGSEVRVHTNGIPAKNMGDALYFRVYALLTDGSYVYGNVSGYHAGLYAKSKLGSTSSSDALKALCVAMVNYGAEAQTYFGYNTDNLMNAFLTDTQKALISAYDSTLVDAVVSASSTKAANFTKNGFSKLSSAVSFEGAFAINYYFTPANTVDGEMTLYWWDAATYNSVSVLTKSNATGSVVMTGTSEYAGAVDGIAAKELDQTIYVVGVYTSGGTEYTTGVLAYSIGHYCKTKAAGTTTMADLAAATAVYGYYAKQYFA